MKVFIITNIPVPYRIPVFNRLSEFQDIILKVGYMASIEENRKWTLPEITHDAVYFEKTKTINKKDGFNFIHFNKGVWTALNEFDPDIVITTGFNPAHLRSWFWTRIKGKKHIGWTDGWLKSEEMLTPIHRMLRKLIYRNTEAFVGASHGSLDLFKHYGASSENVFQSALVIDNKRFESSNKPFEERSFDLVFSGSITYNKNPLFLTEVLAILKGTRPDISIRFLGKGPQQQELEQKLKEINIRYEFAGHVDQAQIPGLMADAKLHVFPTIQEAWGIVINEAGATGTPTISSHFTAADNELVINNKTGFALDLDAHLWAEKIDQILGDPEHWKKLSLGIQEKLSGYTFDKAAIGAFEACNYAIHLS